MRPLTASVLMICAILAVASSAGAQIPDEFTNLQVLPKDISKPELVAAMRSFAGALGVRCKYCHVGPDDLQGMDFANDELPTKKIARQMMRMVGSINKDHLSKLETNRDTEIRVECVTCHRGVAIPVQIDDLVATAIRAKGLDPAITQYRELRDMYYGRAAYDFGPQPLNSLAERLLREGDSDSALALAKLNVELHPRDAWTQAMLGGVHKERGEKDQAIAAFEEALKLEPDNRWAKRQLAELKSETGQNP